MDLLLRQLLRLYDQSFFLGHFNDFLLVQSCAVISNLDENVSSLASGANRDRPRLGFTAFFTLGGWFNAMIQGIADHVQQRVLEILDHRSIHLDVFSLNS